jgi:hypothetical protein
MKYKINVILVYYKTMDVLGISKKVVRLKPIGNIKG